MNKRLFFGIFPDLETRERLQELQRSIDCQAKPVVAENFHLTLGFLGNCDPAQVQQITEAAGAVKGGSFAIHLNGYHVFRKPKVLACIPPKPQRKLITLYKNLATALRPCEIHLQKAERFHPHVSLFRNVNSLPLVQHAPQDIVWEVDSFSLIESQLLPTKAHYIALRDYAL